MCSRLSERMTSFRIVINAEVIINDAMQVLRMSSRICEKGKGMLLCLFVGEGWHIDGRF